MIGSTAFGLKVDSLENPKAPFREYGRKIFDYDFYRNMEFLTIFFFPGLVKYLKPKFFGKKATNFLRSLFWDVIEQRVGSGQKRNDLIDLLIEMREKYRNDESLKDYSTYLLQCFTIFCWWNYLRIVRNQKFRTTCSANYDFIRILISVNSQWNRRKITWLLLPI